MKRHRLNYGDLKLRVAERVRFVRESSGVLAVPTDAGELDRIVRALADAQRQMLCAVDPRTGRSVSWRWLERPVSVDVGLINTGVSPPDMIVAGGDPHRWLIDQNVMDVPQGPVSFVPESGSGGAIPVRTFRHVYELGVADPDSMGWPRAVGFRMAANNARGDILEMALYPKPSQNCTVSFMARVHPAPLADNEQVGPWPMWIDDLLIALAVKVVFASDREAGSAARTLAMDEANAALVNAIAMDRHSGSDVIPPPSERIVAEAPRYAGVIDSATGAVILAAR